MTSAPTQLPFIPDSAPFDAQQRAWLNGFLAALLGGGRANGYSAELAAKTPLLILFGSQSGNAEALAKKLARTAGTRGFNARAVSMDAVEAAALEKETNVLFITSTWGEGDMPDNAAPLWQSLNQNGSSPKLAGTNYAVLALGDRNYGDTFCLAGKRFDERLAELGARRLFERVDCDVDYDEPAARWAEGVFTALGVAEPQRTAASVGPAVGAHPDDVVTAPPDAETAPAFSKQNPFPARSKQNPFPARLVANRRLNREGSAKDTRHIELLLDGSVLDYEVGDALGVFPVNCPALVARVMEAQGLDPETAVPLPDGREAPLRDALACHYEIRHLSGQAPRAGMTPHGFVEGLRRLQPRLYSIASSPKAHPNEVHLCVATVRYEEAGELHQGVASTFLADRLPAGETAGTFVHKSPHFRLPVALDAPVIMVGPGTGIAPFRAFLEERAITGAFGRNWLFFGDQHAATDFLYQDEIEQFLRRGILHRLDVAFSRDRARKIYVQHRMLSQAMELWRWLQEGAFFYVCGDASRMAKDVDAALHHVARVVGGLDVESAAAYVADMKKSKRYLRDVY